MKYSIDKPPKCGENVVVDTALQHHSIGVEYILSIHPEYHEGAKPPFLKRLKNAFRWKVEIDFPIKKYLHAFYRDKKGNLRKRTAYSFGFLKIFGPFLD